jgi:pantoate--beta-alanine ligase
MEICKTIKSLQAALSVYRSRNAFIGFVPTMGALHKGHLSLVEESLSANDITVVSIYVNPSQFNDKNDFRNYPRNLQLDCKLLKKTGCNLVFAPDDNEMYPSDDTRKFDFGQMGSVMEGNFRPGHFNGVTQIVTKMFDAVKPHRAYFGRKDFQQLAIIRKLANNYHYTIEIIGCPIVREHDGLAMSSRNALLAPEYRKAAPLIYQTLIEAKDMIFHSNVLKITTFVEKTINSNPFLKLEYFQIVDTYTLTPVEELRPENPATACIAVYAGKVRLIDNIEFIS